MVFTNEDLERLKEYYSQFKSGLGWHDKAVINLIARLEAAELVAEQFIEENDCNSFCGYHCRNVVRWRKAAGKE